MSRAVILWISAVWLAPMISGGPAPRPCGEHAPPAFEARASNGTRRLVVLGSSTAVGLGASDPAHSWVGLLDSALSGSGLLLMNQSISGTKTADSLARFQRDVARYQPDFVVLATSLWNENFGAAPLPASAAYLANTKTLVAMAQAAGALPVVLGPYPNRVSTPRHAEIVRSIYLELEKLGVPVWDGWDGIANDAGDWLPGLSADGTHPVNRGHLRLFDAIPVSLFPAAYAGSALAESAIPGSFTSMSPDASIAVSLDTAAPSWTVAAWTHENTASAGAALFSASSGLSLVQTTIGYDLYLRGELLASVPAPRSPKLPWRYLMLSYQRETSALSLLIDGSQAARLSVSGLAPLSSFVFGEGCPQCEFAEVTANRVGFSPGAAGSGNSSLPLLRSLDFWMTFASPQSASNGAGTLSAAALRGEWTFNPAPRPCAVPVRRGGLR